MNWYAIQTKPRQEAVAEMALREQGLETFYPRLGRRQTRARSPRWALTPLFPGYVFARFDFEAYHRRVCYAKGVSRIVGFGGRPAVVEASLISELRGQTQDNVIAPTHPVFEIGDAVEVRHGPLGGLQGVFEGRLNSRDRVRILLKILGASVRADMDWTLLQRA